MRHSEFETRLKILEGSVFGPRVEASEVTCLRCGAWPGVRCFTPGGRWARKAHREREDVAKRLRRNPLVLWP